MDRFLIITNLDKDKDYQVTERIAAYIRKAGKKVILSRDLAHSTAGNLKAMAKDVDCVIVLGGDGTIIKAANDLIELNIPLLGVNLGTVGFLAEIEVHHVYDAMDKLFHDKYSIENRMMLEGIIKCNGANCLATKELPGYALNDIVITRKGFSRIIHLGIYVNDDLVDDFRGDGVIISTPTGSTAYNLSAGGPIVIPKADVMVITPICPHSLSPRSIIVPAEDTIRVVVGKSKKTLDAEAIVTYDGNEVIDLGPDDEVIMRKAQYDTKLIKLNHTGIYEILRSKLGHN